MKIWHDKSTAWSDWRNQDAYPTVEGTTIEQWAWEFLRRNPAYIDDWNQYVTEFIRRKWGRLLSVAETQTEEFEQRFNFLTSILQVDDDKDLEVYDPPLTEGETESTWRQRVGDSGQKLSLHRWYGHKWGLLLMIDPASADGYLHFGLQPLIRHKTTQGGRVLSRGYCGAFSPLPSKIHCSIKVTLDLEIPLEGQLQFVRQFLEKEKNSLVRRNLMAQADNGRLHVNLYHNYLRILDAEVAGIGLPEIGAKLHPDKEDGFDNDYGRTKRVRQQKAAAYEMRDRGFWELIGNNWRLTGS